MLIGSNNGNPMGNNMGNRPSLNQNNSFVNNNMTRNNSFDQNRKKMDANNNVFTKKLTDFQHTNPTNNDDIYDRSLAVLNERLKNNEISIEEFSKKCAQIGKERAKKQ